MHVAVTCAAPTKSSVSRSCSCAGNCPDKLLPPLLLSLLRLPLLLLLLLLGGMSPTFEGSAKHALRVTALRAQPGGGGQSGLKHRPCAASSLFESTDTTRARSGVHNTTGGGGGGADAEAGPRGVIGAPAPVLLAAAAAGDRAARAAATFSFSSAFATRARLAALLAARASAFARRLRSFLDKL